MAFNANATGTYIWAYTKAAAAAVGVTLSNSDLQTASNTIAPTVFGQLQLSNFVFSDNIADAHNFAPKSIISDDAGPGIDKLNELHPGANLTFAEWGGTLFARTELQDPTYFSDYGIDLTPGSRDCAAITAGSMGAVNSVIGNLLPILWNQGPINALTNAIPALQSQDNAAIKACFPQQQGSLGNGSSTLSLDESGNLIYNEDTDGQPLQTTTISYDNAISVTGFDTQNAYPWSSQTAQYNVDGSALSVVTDYETADVWAQYHDLADAHIDQLDAQAATTIASQIETRVSRAWRSARARRRRSRSKAGLSRPMISRSAPMRCIPALPSRSCSRRPTADSISPASSTRPTTM